MKKRVDQKIFENSDKIMKVSVLPSVTLIRNMVIKENALDAISEKALFLARASITQNKILVRCIRFKQFALIALPHLPVRKIIHLH